MRPDFDNPNYWKSLYERPVQSNTQGVVAGSTGLEQGDLEAELDPYAAKTPESTSIDQQAVMQIVEELVETRLQALMAEGWGPPGKTAPPTQAAPPQQAVAPFQDPAPTPEEATDPEDAVTQRQPTVAPFQDPPPQRQQAVAPFQDPPPRRPTPPPERRTTPPPQAAAKTGVGGAIWDRVPDMPGGQAAMFKAGDLSPEAIQLLVMVDGSTSLRGLRQLVPHLDDQAFIGIIRAGIKKGILTLS